MAKQEEKTPKEASEIFHNIMKASVTPKKFTDKELVDIVYEKFGAKIVSFDNDGDPIYASKLPDNQLNEIRNYIHNYKK